MISRLTQRIVPLPRAWLALVAGYAAIAGLLFASMGLLRFLGQPELATRLPWYLSRAAGITAYLLLTAATVLGLVNATRIAGRVLPRPVVFGLHEHLAWLGLAAVGLHLGALLGDSYVSFAVADVLVPFLAPYRPVAVAFGIVAFYLSAVVTISFYFRARIGYRAWRAIHMASFVTYALATVHGIVAGTSAGQPWMQWLYLTSAGAVLFLVNYRLLLMKHAPSPTRQRVQQTETGTLP